jgi:hypothetical protein
MDLPKQDAIFVVLVSLEEGAMEIEVEESGHGAYSKEAV